MEQNEAATFERLRVYLNFASFVWKAAWQKRDLSNDG
jgi:hypothetical protein